MKGYYPARLMNMMLAGMMPRGVKVLYMKLKTLPAE
jgi:hypothetical protein